LTEEGTAKAEEIWATPYYVSPEAVEHKEEDFRSDMYSLGATLYHALAGEPPVDTEEMSTRVLRLAKRKVRPLAKVAPWLTRETTVAVDRAMAYDRDERYGSHEELRSALEVAMAAIGGVDGAGSGRGEVRLHRRRRRRDTSRAWLVGGAALVPLMAFFAALVVMLRDPGQVSPPEPMEVRPDFLLPRVETGVDPAVGEMISSAYLAAREALTEDDFVVAERQFLRVWEMGEAPAETRAWAAFEGAVAAFLDGRSGDARLHLGALDAYLLAEGEAEAALGRRLRVAAEELRALRFVSGSRLPQRLDDPFRATVFLALSLKAWEQGQLDRAAGWFRKLASAGPWPDAEWMSEYRKLAERYVADHRRLRRVDRSLEGKSAEEIRETVADLHDLYVTLQTRGRARFNVRVWQADAIRVARVRTLPRGVRGWEAHLEQVAGQFRKAEFARASEALKGFAPRTAGEREQRAALVALSDAASAFLAGLARSLGEAPTVAVETRAGQAVDRIVGAQPEGLLVSEDGAARVLPWGELSPASLLAARMELAGNPVAPMERSRLLAEGSAFARLSGLPAEADRLAGLAGKDLPRYGDRWNAWSEILEIE
jgi:hypothetical protein